jgi:hypothetical protein
MTGLAGRNINAIRYGSERVGTVGALIIVAAVWLIPIVSVIGIFSVFADAGWSRAVWVAVLCASVPLALVLTRWVIASRRLRSIAPEPLLDQRYYGSLDVITDSERRLLRPIGCTAREAADRTGALLNYLRLDPSVRIFHGIRPADPNLPLIPHVISAGRQLILLESVAWPPGQYETGSNGHIRCDGTYIGQSVQALRDSARHWSELLPRNHKVAAMVVVHPAGPGHLTLPAQGPKGPVWVLASSAIQELQQRIGGQGDSVSRNAVAALMAATAADPG